MNTFFLSVRVLHILFGAIWLGAAVFVTLLLMPAVREAGPEGGKVMMGLGRRVPVFIASVSGLAVLTGLWLYWRFTDGLDPSLMNTAGGHTFGTGGILGLVAAVIATSVVGQNMKRAVATMKRMETIEPAARQALMEEAIRYRQRAASGGRMVAVLLTVTIVLMGLGHYV
jgi:uncharacterized membrane protein